MVVLNIAPPPLPPPPRPPPPPPPPPPPCFAFYEIAQFHMEVSIP